MKICKIWKSDYGIWIDWCDMNRWCDMVYVWYMNMICDIWYGIEGI